MYLLLVIRKIRFERAERHDWFRRFRPSPPLNLVPSARRRYAFIKRRGYVIPEDVRAVAHDVLRHRIGLTYEAEASNMTSDEIVSKILNKVEVP